MLKDMILIKTGNYIAVAGGNMGAVSRKYVAGIKKDYKCNHLSISEYIPRTDLKQDTRVRFILTFHNGDVLDFYNSIDWSKVAEKNNQIYKNELELINSADLSQAIDYMKQNEKGFKTIMEHLQQNENHSKYMAFVITIKDYYRVSHIFPIEVITKIMIKYGYKFESIKAVHEIYYK